MESFARPQSGQSLVEGTVLVTCLMLFVTLALSAGLAIKKLFKHDFVEKTQSLTPAPEVPMEEIFKDKLMFLKSKHPTKVIEELTSQGWSEKSRIRVDGETLFIFERGDQELLVNGDLGVLSWNKK